MASLSGTLIVGAERIMTFKYDDGSWRPRQSVGAEVLCMCSCAVPSTFFTTSKHKSSYFYNFAFILAQSSLVMNAE